MKALKHLLLLTAALLLCGCMEAAPAPATAGSVPTEAWTVPATEPAQPPAETVDPALKEAYDQNPAAFVCFSRSTEPREHYVSVREILEYETLYPDCNGTWFRDRLEGEDLCIYNAYLYAMEHCFIGFELYVEDNDQDFQYIRESVCLDSPFLEQNINRHGEWTWSRPSTHLGEPIYFGLDQFTESRWEMKMEALETCRQIVAQIPAEYAMQLEKMEYLYRYVCDHVEYVDYEDMSDESFLYDAVCRGETVCDGYSNMLNLLFNLIGVESCEVMGFNENEDVGHTWVAAEVDGMYYNFDPTYEDTVEGLQTDALLFFGFSDELMSVDNPSREDTRPKCTDTSRDFSYADLVVENLRDSGQIQKIADLTDGQTKNGDYVTLVAVRGTVSESDYEGFMDRYARGVYSISRAATSLLSVGSYTLLEITTEPW